MTLFVSILTRPVGRVQRSGRHHHHQVGRVSILTRPVGRVQRRCTANHRRRSYPFQSSPGPWAECNTIMPPIA